MRPPAAAAAADAATSFVRCRHNFHQPRQIGWLTELKLLDLWKNQFEGEIPITFGGLLKCKRLW